MSAQGYATWREGQRSPSSAIICMSSIPRKFLYGRCCVARGIVILTRVNKSPLRDQVLVKVKSSSEVVITNWSGQNLALAQAQDFLLMAKVVVS